MMNSSLLESFCLFFMLEAGKFSQYGDQGLKQILEMSNEDNLVTRTSCVKASNMIRITIPELNSIEITDEEESVKPCNLNKQVDHSFLWVVQKHGDRILLKDSDRKPRASKKKGRKIISWPKTSGTSDDWHGPPPWDPSVGGDACPKFLCDVMVCELNMLFKLFLCIHDNFLIISFPFY